MRQINARTKLKNIFALIGLFAGVCHCSLFAQAPVRWEINSLTEIGGNSTTLFGAPVLITTGADKAIEFDGKDDGIIVNGNPLKQAVEFTVEVIFKPYSEGNFEQRFVHMEQDNGNRILIELRSVPGKKWYLDTFIKSGTSSKTLVDTAKTHPSDKWYHAALVYKNGVMTHFVNGVEELTGAVTYIPVVSGKTSVGMRLNNIHFYKGAVKTVKVSHKALLPSDFITAETSFLNKE